MTYSQMQPQTQVLPQVDIQFIIGSLIGKNHNKRLQKFEYKGIVNGGYIIKFKINDPNFNLLKDLIKNGYLKKSRNQMIEIKFQLKASSEGEYPRTATKKQTAILTSVQAHGDSADIGYLEFIGIDPPTWYLSRGKASGKAYTGNVSSVIKQVITEYAPNIELEISETIDSTNNKFWMYRQDPKTFINSLVDWSSAITRNKTNFVITSDDNKLIIKEQAEIKSKQRAYYRYWTNGKADNIKSWKYLSDNALSILQTKLITQGLSATSGQYLDRITDTNETKVYVKDSTTPKKQIALTKEDESFTKANDEVGSSITTGWSSAKAIPEIYSAGDIGITYDEYIDGKARGSWLNMLNDIMRIKLKVIGHGEWSNCTGLGTDTVWIQWASEKGDTTNTDIKYFMSGNWLVYGYHHILTSGKWDTQLYLARYDHDSIATKVGKEIK